MKLTFKKILKEIDQSIEDWSSEMEGGEETPQQKTQRMQTNQLTPQQVQGTQGAQDVEYTDLEGIANAHRINPQQMTALLQSIKSNGFSPQLYSQLKSMVGDIDNFMLDLQEYQPEWYSALQNAGLDRMNQMNAQQFMPAQGKQINQLQMKFPSDPAAAKRKSIAAPVEPINQTAPDKTNPQRRIR